MSEIMKSLDQWRQKNFEFINPYIAMGIQGAFDKLEHYYPIRDDDIQPLKTLYLATVLDPRLKLGVFVTLEFSRITIDSIEKYFHEVYSKYKGEYELELSSVRQTKRSKTNETSLQPGGNLNGAPSFFSYKGTSVDDNELLLYLRESQEDGNSSIREFYEARKNSFPVIRRMARDFLSIMAMSSPAESLFSQVKNIVTDKRNRLLPATIKLLAVLKARGVIPDEINTIRDSELAANPKEVVITPISAQSFDDSEGSETYSEGKETFETGGFSNARCMVSDEECETSDAELTSTLV